MLNSWSGRGGRVISNQLVGDTRSTNSDHSRVESDHRPTVRSVLQYCKSESLGSSACSDGPAVGVQLHGADIYVHGRLHIVE